LKYRPIAIEVINRLRSLKYLSSKLYEFLLEATQNGEPFKAFEILHSRMVEAGWTVGWNKVLRNGSIYSWYANQVTVYPLRLAVMEIESDDDIYESCRQSLLNLNNIIHAGTDSSRFKIKGIQQTDPYAISLGVSPLYDYIDKFGIAVLHRLNLDMRDRPIIERWHWTGGVSSIVLSDGGRYQISRDTIWARAIETGIGANGRLDSVMKDFIGGIFPDTKELRLPPEMINSTGKCLARFIERLVVYRVARLEVDMVVFIVEPGKFPELAIKLWG